MHLSGQPNTFLAIVACRFGICTGRHTPTALHAGGWTTTLSYYSGQTTTTPELSPKAWVLLWGSAVGGAFAKAAGANARLAFRLWAPSEPRPTPRPTPWLQIRGLALLWRARRRDNRHSRTIYTCKPTHDTWVGTFRPSLPARPWVVASHFDKMEGIFTPWCAGSETKRPLWFRVVTSRWTR